MYWKNNNEILYELKKKAQILNKVVFKKVTGL